MGFETAGVRLIVEGMKEFTRDLKSAEGSVKTFSDSLLKLGNKMPKNIVAGFGEMTNNTMQLGAAIGALSPEISLAVAGFKLYSKAIDSTGVEMSELRKFIGLAIPPIGILDRTFQTLKQKIEPIVEGIGKLALVIGRVLVGAVKIAVGVVGGLAKMFISLGKSILSVPLNVLKSIWESLKRIGEIALGILVRDSIRAVFGQLSEMKDKALEAAEGFQVLRVRLEGLMARQFLKEDTTGTLKFADALKQAIPQAKGLFKWMAMLAIQTPFDTVDVAQTFTLATSYGLLKDQAVSLTEAILEFSAGMGLSNVASTRITENFGQMIAQGKITGTELRDLGRGAFVPVTDIMIEAAKAMGILGSETRITAKEMNDFARENGIDPVIALMEGFIDVVGREFVGAGERMSKTLTTIKNNMGNLIETFIGVNMLSPILDRLSEKAAGFLTALTGGVAGDQFFSLTEMIGKQFGTLVDTLMENLPSVEEVADRIREIVGNIFLSLVALNQGDTHGAWAALGVPEEVILSIEKFDEWLDNLKVTLKEVWEALKIGDFQAAFLALGVPQTVIDGLKDIWTGLKNLKTFWDQNGSKILTAVGEGLERIFNALGISIDTSSFTSLTESFLKWTEGLDSDTIVGNIESVTTSIADFITALKNGNLSVLGPNIEAIATGFSNFADSMKKVGEFIGNMNALLTWFQTLASLPDTIMGAILSQGMQNEAAQKVDKSLMPAGENVFTQMIESIKTAFLTLLTGETSPVMTVKKVIEEIKTAFGVLQTDLIGTSLPELFSSAYDAFSAGFDLIVNEPVTKFKTDIITKMQELSLELVSTTARMMSVMYTVFDTGFRSILNGVIIPFVMAAVAQIQFLMEQISTLIGMMGGVGGGGSGGSYVSNATSIGGSKSVSNLTKNYNFTINSTNKAQTGTRVSDDVAAALMSLS